MVSEIYIVRRFLKDGYYSQYVISAIAKESLKNSLTLHKGNRKQNR